MSGGRYPNPYPPMRIPATPGPLYDDMRFPGRGYLPRPGEDRPALSEWGRLSRGGAFGKKTNLVFQAGGADRITPAGETILAIQGDDADAKQLVVTLGPPLVVAAPFSQTLTTKNPQNQAVSQDSGEMQDRGNFPGILRPIEWPPIIAILEWGIGGSGFRATVDFLNGATISLAASYLRIKAAIESGTDLDISGTSAIYTLNGFVGPGQARSNAQRTVYVGAVPSLTESAVFEVPPFAKRAYVVGCDPTPGPGVAVTVATLRFWQSPDGVAGGTCVGNFVVTGNQPLAFPVPGGAAYASVLNEMGVSSRMSIVYTLSI